jgi:16S rRNA (cytosine967-C5)-methyltransferase
MNARAQALNFICQVIVAKRSLNEVLKNLSGKDAPFIQALCYGVCRAYFRLEYILQLLLEKPLKAKDQDVYCLLLMGLYQLSEMRIPAHAAVSETVALTKTIKKEWAKGLINAVLRNFLRKRDELQPEITKNVSAKYAHPKWLIAKLKQDWPEDWQAIVDANNAHPPFSLRVNVEKAREMPSLREFVARASSENDERIHAIPYTRSGIILDPPVPVSQLPGWQEGAISVQDGAAQLVPELLMLQKDQYVLDACAAPGGKTAHILETADVELVAIDKDPERLALIHENLSRLRLTATCLAADVADTPSWWSGRQFERILLDAPCSASGVIRRHPDIKILRRPADIAKLADEQRRLMQAVWSLLAPDGILVYATCSVFCEENMEVMADFLKENSDAFEEKILADWGKPCQIGRQILPGMNEMDGFYFARFRKV